MVISSWGKDNTDQKIAAVSHNIIRYSVFPAELQDPDQALFIPWHHKKVCRPADPEGSMTAHRLIKQYAVFSGDLYKIAV